MLGIKMHKQGRWRWWRPTWEGARGIHLQGIYLMLFLLFLPSIIGAIGAEVAKKEYAHHHADSHYVLRCLHENNIADMTSMDKRLVIISTRTVHPFLMTTIHNEVDRAVSMKLRDFGLWDPQVLGPMQFIIQERPCNSESFVIDVGANIGFFSGFALSMGCNTVIFEPQRLPASAVKSTLCLNAHAHKKARVLSQFVQHPVSTQERLSFPVRNRLHVHNTGGAGADDCVGAHWSSDSCQMMRTVNLDVFMFGTAAKQKQSANVTRIIPGSAIRVLKIDAEGYESDVFTTMEMILRKGVAENILFEMIPHIMGLEKNIEAVKSLYEAGYFVAECPFAFLEGVRSVDKPFIKEVIPLDMEDAIALVTAMFNERDHNNWRKKHYTDMWAASDPNIFARYNKLVYPA